MLQINCNSAFISLDICVKNAQNNCVKKDREVMELYSNEPRMMNRDTAQLMIEEMKNELERQKKLLDKKDREI